MISGEYVTDRLSTVYTTLYYNEFEMYRLILFTTSFNNLAIDQFNFDSLVRRAPSLARPVLNGSSHQRLNSECCDELRLSSEHNYYNDKTCAILRIPIITWLKEFSTMICIAAFHSWCDKLRTESLRSQTGRGEWPRKEVNHVMS